MALTGLREENPRPDEQALRLGLTGNLCRCTGYVQILESVQHAARLLAEDREKAVEASDV
jgi:carbon-monoxide dehydrogenase small subunit